MYSEIYKAQRRYLFSLAVCPIAMVRSSKNTYSIECVYQYYIYKRDYEIFETDLLWETFSLVHTYIYAIVTAKFAPFATAGKNILLLHTYIYSI